jgi:hypothetical protein
MRYFFVMAMNNIDKKTKYLERELWILAWNASVQHAALYKNGAWQNQRDQIDRFRAKVIDHIKSRIIPQYKEAVEELRHCENIRGLIDYANGVDTAVLGKDGYKYGVAQKLVNLALKYYWCLGLIKEPPHCPVDKIVIDKTVFRGKVNWTQILTEREYLEIISAIRSLGREENCSIAQWELNNFERRGP